MRVAVIGTGIAGNAAAWALSKRYPVTVYECELRPGTFNPLSVYFCYRVEGELALMIYEVRNTFGDIHAYVLAVKPGELSEAGLRQQQDKLFYVSPFSDMPMRYHFRVSPPAADVKLRILETDSAGPLLAATFHGRRRDLSAAQLLRSFFALPLVTLKIVAAIGKRCGFGSRACAWCRAAFPQPDIPPSTPPLIRSWRAPKALIILHRSRMPEEERSSPVTVDVSDRPLKRRAGHRATSSDESAHAGSDPRDPRKC